MATHCIGSAVAEPSAERPGEHCKNRHADEKYSQPVLRNTKRGRNADERRAVRQDRSRPIIDGLEPWLRAKLALISQKTKLAEAIRYALSRWNGLICFLDGGRIEIDSNVVERSIRPIALTRKNALFAGSDEGASYCSCRHPFIKAAYFVGDY